jgi:hypothetical protein
MDPQSIGADRKPVVLSREQLATFFTSRYSGLFATCHDPLKFCGITDAPTYNVQWYSEAWGHREPRPRIVTPLDDDGLAHGVERYFYEGLTSEGSIRFHHGEALEIIKMPFSDSLAANAMPLTHLHQINLTPKKSGRPRRDYHDMCGLGRHTVCRFLLAAAGDGMRSLPVELRVMIFSYVLPPQLHDRKRLGGLSILPCGFAAMPWLVGI